MIRSLLLGNNEDAPYHPLAAVEQELFSILDGICDITSTVDREQLDELTTERFDLLISYTDSWDQALDSQRTADILGFVTSGGGMLVIHNGISLQARPELSQIIGAKFTGHPAYGSLDFEVNRELKHPILDEVTGFTMDEEPYRFDIDSFASIDILLTYRHEGQSWPAAWTRSYGLGRVLFLMPGHHAPSFKHEEYRRWIAESAKWAAGMQ